MRPFFRLLSTALAVLLVMPATSAFAVVWHQTNGLSFSSSSHGYMVGGFSAVGAPNIGFVSETKDGGRTWTSSAVPEFVRAVGAQGSNGLAVGVFNQPWLVQPGPQAALTAAAISGSDNNKYYGATVLAGGRLAVVGSRTSAAHGYPAFIATSTNNGATWNSAAYEGPKYPQNSEGVYPQTYARLEAIDGDAAGNIAWAIGNEFKDSQNRSYHRPLVFKSTDGGATWPTTTQSLPSTLGNSIMDVATVNNNVAVITGPARMLYFTTNGGSSWSGGPGHIPLSPSGTSTTHGQAVDALSADMVLVAGRAGRIAWSSNARSNVQANWRFFTIPGNPDLTGATMLSATEWIVVGHNETIYRTTDGGVTWRGTTGVKDPRIGVALNGSSKVSGWADDRLGDEAGVGVANVEICVKGPGTLGYLNAAGVWQSTPVWLAATPSPSNGWLSWTYDPWTVPNNGVGYEILARATDGVGRSTTVQLQTAGATTGTIMGVVTADGQPLGGVSVKVGSMPAVLTQPNGSYAVAGVNAGTHAVTFSRTGYTSQTHSIAVTAGQTVTRNVALVATSPTSVTPKRVSGGNRFAGSAAIARDSYASKWGEVRHVVIASGEDRAAADPLAAAGLCGALNAPLLLVSSRGVDADVKKVFDEIAAAQPANTKLTVHIVGGPASVPEPVYDQLVSGVPSSKLTKNRLLESGGRYEMAAKIAAEIKRLTGGNPQTVLIANGADPSKFFDALALSPISASQRFPILLVAADSVPAATRSALNDLKPTQVIVGGGPNTVTTKVYGEVKATDRWSGTSRYTTALQIADKAIAEGWARSEWIGVAAALPDALAGGSAIGMTSGVLVLTERSSERLTADTGTWIRNNRSGVKACRLYGGQVSLTPAVEAAVADRLAGK